MITIKHITSKSDIKKFVLFQHELYKDNPCYVPPIFKDEQDIFDTTKNQVFKNADCWLFLAYLNGKIVGRIAAIINYVEINEQHRSKMRFGWLDMIDDLVVTKTLLSEVERIGKEKKLEYIEGPLGFSNMDKGGMLIHGFDEMNTMITWYNYPYYKKHMEELGFVKETEWVEFKFQTPNPIPEKINKFASIIAERYKLTNLKFKTAKEILPYVEDMFGLLNKTYSSLVSFVPIQQYQIDLYKTKYMPYINPDFVELVIDQDKKLIGFSVTMPSFSKALKKANGSLFPFGFLHLLRAKNKNTKAAFYLIGIDPVYQGKGVTAMIFRNITQNLINYNITECETNPELADNLAVQASWKNYNPTLHKRRSTYRKEL